MFLHGRTQFALTHNNTNRIMPEIAGQARNDGIVEKMLIWSRDTHCASAKSKIKHKNIKINDS